MFSFVLLQKLNRAAILPDYNDYLVFVMFRKASTSSRKDSETPRKEMRSSQHSHSSGEQDKKVRLLCDLKAYARAREGGICICAAL